MFESGSKASRYLRVGQRLLDVFEGEPKASRCFRVGQRLLDNLGWGDSRYLRMR